MENEMRDKEKAQQTKSYINKIRKSFLFCKKKSKKKVDAVKFETLFILKLRSRNVNSAALNNFIIFSSFSYFFLFSFDSSQAFAFTSSIFHHVAISYFLFGEDCFFRF